MNVKHRWSYFVTFFTLGVFFVGCAGPRTPIHLDPSFSKRQIDVITLLPIVDIRKDKSFEIDLEEKIRVPVQEILEEKGYSVTTPRIFAEGSQPSAEEISEMDVSELSMLGPSNSDFLLLVYVEDVSSTYAVISSTFKIETAATLIDRKGRSSLWRDKGVGSSGSGGLITSVLMKGLNRSFAISNSLDAMLSTFPEKDEKP